MDDIVCLVKEMCWKSTESRWCNKNETGLRRRRRINNRISATLLNCKYPTNIRGQNCLGLGVKADDFEERHLPLFPNPAASMVIKRKRAAAAAAAVEVDVAPVREISLDPDEYETFQRDPYAYLGINDAEVELDVEVVNFLGQRRALNIEPKGRAAAAASDTATLNFEPPQPLPLPQPLEPAVSAKSAGLLCIILFGQLQKANLVS